MGVVVLTPEEIIEAAQENKERYKRWRALDWELFKYERDTDILAERTKYLEEKLLPNFECVEDDLLPEELIIDYVKGGTNLICPVGTESERGSWCLG